MPSRRAGHAYDQYQMESLKVVVVPAKIRCGRCTKNLPPTKYSENQLTDLRYQIKTAGVCTKPINCQKCTGQQIVEIECIMCHKTKGLEDFAKTQRRKPDSAKCYKCTEEQVTHEPVNHDRYESEDLQIRTFRTLDHSNGVQPVYWSTAESDLQSSGWGSINGEEKALNDGGVALAGHLQRAASISGSASGTLIETDSEISYPGRNGNADGWSEAPSGRTGSWHTGARSTAAGSGSNGRPSTTSNVGTQRSYPSSVAERSDTSGSSRFPKIRAHRPSDSASVSASPMTSGTSTGHVRSPFVRPAGDTIRELDEAWESESEDEDEHNDDDSGSDGENTVI